ncbi:MAG: SDR family oxidoreductase [Bacteriovoracaceae bacterium]|nr:SDR family oxidoreductase [Bacteriovoracaceae bacterium]
MNINLENKKTLIFGASSGIGRGIAELFYHEQAHVCASSRGGQKLELLKKNLGDSITLLPGDLYQAGQAALVTKRAVEAMKGLDILVLNAGGPPKGSFESITAEQWQQSFQSLWLSVVESVQVALPALKASGCGRIILIASSSAIEPIANLIISNGLRAGLLGLMKSLSNETAAFGITVNVILPGFIDTDRLKELGNSEESMIKQIPMGRLGKVEEIAQLVAFLASDLASYITGQLIACDGGGLRVFRILPLMKKIPNRLILLLSLR